MTATAEVVFTDDEQRSPWLTLIYDRGEDDNRGEVLWRRGDAIVRHTGTQDGISTLRRCGEAGVEALLAAALDGARGLVTALGGWD